ncbi:SRPBCC family protein [Micromonospora sp. NPDC048871]|uniref:SRPBCC family protein n=1 Tax=unclassified Micromonospora TaxID=2617518 RepID=UPI002E1264EF|nr:SRPBCC family protein [Micromonospora sp. NBC_01739]
MQTASRPLFELSVQSKVSAPPDRVYALVSDLERSGEWSPECVGGSWIAGEPGTVGAVFRGENRREADVVAWAPVVRGVWFTESEVVTAEPGRTFAWSMRNRAGARQDSVWAYDIAEQPGGGSVLVHRFRMGAATEGIRGITADMDAAARERFFAEWGAKVAGDMRATLGRLCQVLEED